MYLQFTTVAPLGRRYKETDIFLRNDRKVSVVIFATF